MKAALEDWIAEGWLKVVEEKDAERKTRQLVVVVGDPAESMAKALTAGVAERDGNADYG